MSLKSKLIKRFLDAARSLANQGMSKEAIMQFAKNEFGEISELFQKQIDNILMGFLDQKVCPLHQTAF